jgi:hypothetical protein
MRNDDILQDMMSQGQFIEEVLDALGMTVEQHNELLEKDPSYVEAMTKGEMSCYVWWLSYGRNNLDNRNFNNTIYAMVMRNRFGWTDTKKRETEIITDNASRETENIKKFRIVR